MKRGLALALLTLATCAVVSAQIRGVPPSVTSMGPGRSFHPGVPASVTSLGPRGFSPSFGHHPGFVKGVRNRELRRRFFPGYGYYYWPYYGYYGWDYPYDYYSTDAYQQQTQPVVVVVDPKSSEDRYGDHSFEEQRSAPPQQAKAPPSPPEEQEATLLVFRDGHKQEVRNYAIAGQVLWDFGAKGTHKIPLSDLDLETTRKLNDERGVDFVLPKT